MRATRCRSRTDNFHLLRFGQHVDLRDGARIERVDQSIPWIPVSAAFQRLEIGVVRD
jgi:hypothetical protein